MNLFSRLLVAVAVRRLLGNRIHSDQLGEREMELRANEASIEESQVSQDGMLELTEVTLALIGGGVGETVVG